MKKKIDEQASEEVQPEVVKETRQAYIGRLKPPSSKADDEARHHDDLGYSIPEFRTREEFDAWWDALPKVEADVDPRLKERVNTSIRLSRRTIEGFDFLAKQKGIRSGQTLMKIVLESYLAKSLPPDF